MIGRLIDGRYQVRSRIARGGMATVYLATDLRLERRVALKIMHGHLADDSTFKSRFVQEARSAARLAHPNVVNVFDQGQDADIAYLVMEYLPGITLRDLLKEHGQLTAAQTLDIMSAVLHGLAAAHKAGIVHRDLKPENILLADDGRIKISDFGLARAVNNNTATGQALLGTIAYLSPELVTRGVADARSDIYALGIVMYEMLTGEQPFKGEQPMQIAYQHANDQVPAPSAKNPRVPVELDELVLWATARDPEKRPRDATAMLDQLIEVENAVLGFGQPGSHQTQPTAVLPRGYAVDHQTTGQTQLLVPAKAAPPQVLDKPGQLAVRANRRRRKGYWLFSLVILLAAVAGGTGWYFGQGPGGLVEVPVTAGTTPEVAAAMLQDIGLIALHGTDTHPTIAAGIVITSNPGPHTMLKRGSDITVIVSEGPKDIEVPTLAGLSQQEASDLIASAGFVQGEVTNQFSGKVKRGVVIRATDTDGGELPELFPERSTIALVVSDGAVPDVEGDTLDQAQQRLTEVGLEVNVADNQFSNEVDKGRVISMSVPDGTVTRGAVIDLVISKGQDLVEVPDVVGMTRDEASKALEDTGFRFAYADFFKVIPDALTKVTSSTPAAGEMAVRDKVVTLGITVSG